MASTVLRLFLDQFDNRLSIGNITISQKEYLFRISIDGLVGKYFCQGVIDLCSAHIGAHSFDFFESFIQVLFIVFLTSVEHGF
jgi:hypothetical protein